MTFVKIYYIITLLFGGAWASKRLIAKEEKSLFNFVVFLFEVLAYPALIYFDKEQYLGLGWYFQAQLFDDNWVFSLVLTQEFRILKEKEMDSFTKWYHEFEDIVSKTQTPEFYITELVPEDFVGLYEAGLTPYEAVQLEFPDEY